METYEMSVTKKFTSPKGEIEWATIDGEGKANLSGKMQYVANVVVDSDDPIVDSINEFWDEHKPKGFKKAPKSTGIYPYKAASGEKDEDGKDVYEEVEGKCTLAFKTGTHYTDGQPKKIQIYNSKARKVELPKDTKIGNGTIGQISGAMGIYQTMSPNGKSLIDAGVTLYLNSIKISKLVEYEGDGDNFEPDEDGEEGWTGDEGWEGDDSTTEEPAAKGKPKL